jgi:hypothetical protein
VQPEAQRTRRIAASTAGLEPTLRELLTVLQRDGTPASAKKTKKQPK